MNLQILKWLLANKDALLRVVELAKSFDRTAPYLSQWEVVDKIARIVLPILEQQAVQPRLLGFDSDVLDQYDVAYLAAGAEVQALGIDYKLLIDTIIPIIIAILQAILGRDE